MQNSVEFTPANQPRNTDKTDMLKQLPRLTLVWDTGHRPPTICCQDVVF